ncbi:hypothetical protein A1Y69_001666 [Escherichia coli]|uniref:hypothetical protein n=1 Tax=Escherichia coli TaxID=562 RepID=UPI0001F92B9A|nr:hypothetical protein [Escherichia coli]EFZ57395.1 hypothetical protein ECLT68_3661 [Escherichia coli LT-68]EHD3454644.1 hypothetical protein [Escherichia coli O124]EFJ6930541.1 hypothetical protein [Escherichia coli]EFK6622646.1 hypothetical protein [Escherichia coli]EFK6636520.1 hypothetical protein [Escherichia coli]
MNRKQKQELKYFLRKEIARLEDVESQSSEIPFGMDINDARMLQAYRIALAALQRKAPDINPRQQEEQEQHKGGNQ